MITDQLTGKCRILRYTTFFTIKTAFVLYARRFSKEMERLYSGDEYLETVFKVIYRHGYYILSTRRESYSKTTSLKVFCVIELIDRPQKRSRCSFNFVSTWGRVNKTKAVKQPVPNQSLLFFIGAVAPHMSTTSAQ